MVQVLSKLPVTCADVLHPWRKNCAKHSIDAGLYAFYYGLQINTANYILPLLAKRKIPTKKVYIKTLFSILNSSAFMSGYIFTTYMFNCCFWRILGSEHISFSVMLSACLSSFCSIMIETKSRRELLTQFQANIATEWLWNVLKKYELVKDIQLGKAIIFSASIGIFLMLYKAGLHKNQSSGRADIVFSILRFIVGRSEENGYIPHNNCKLLKSDEINSGYTIKTILNRFKCFKTNSICPHSNNCLYYTFHGMVKMYLVGFGIEKLLALVKNYQKVFRNPMIIKQILVDKNSLNIAKFLSSFVGIFRAMSCLLRWITGIDTKYNTLIAGFIAGFSYRYYNNTTIALYFMWKIIFITYSLGMNAGYLPNIPYFLEFFYTVCTAPVSYSLFLYPNTIRFSFWKTMNSITGERLHGINLPLLTPLGYNSAKEFEMVAKRIKTNAVIRNLF